MSLHDDRLNNNDFHRNGIESDLDELDRYLAFDRQTRYAMSCMIKQPSASSLSETLMNNIRRNKKNQVCVFCKNNGETLSVYGNHTLKDAYNRTVCPILRRYTCPKCNATGDNAHTIKYCPMSEVDDSFNTILLLRTPRTSSGRQRLANFSRIESVNDFFERPQN